MKRRPWPPSTDHATQRRGRRKTSVLQKNASHAAVLVSMLLLIQAVPLCAQGVDARLKQLAESLVANVSAEQTSKGKTGSLGCLVMDFYEESGKHTRLGVQLADQFSRALVQNRVGLKVGDRSAIGVSLDVGPLNDTRRRTEHKAIELAESFGAGLAVIGGISQEADLMELKVRLVDRKGHSLSEASQSLVFSDYFRALSALPPHPTTARFRYWPDIPLVPAPGYSELKCTDCQPLITVMLLGETE